MNSLFQLIWIILNWCGCQNLLQMFRRKVRVILLQPHTWCHISDTMKIYETVTSHLAYIRLRMDQWALTTVTNHSLISIEVTENLPLKSESTMASWKSRNETFRWFEKQNLFHILNITKKLWHIEYNWHSSTANVLNRNQLHNILKMLFMSE